ncbi:MAG: hypothetical protein HPM95_19750 [Alphaproteobacteria bacterium]|nr:hypothetical protein [Alphaproteobacteria bacterium]
MPRRRETPPAPQLSQAANPATESGFRDRIRSALEQIDASGRIAPSEPEPGEPMRLLPPLDPPVFIDVTPDR